MSCLADMTDFDFNDVAGLELEAYQLGYQEGERKGRTFGFIEGKALGLEKGFEIWSELAYYEGFINTFKDLLTKAEEAKGASRKMLKQKQQLDMLEMLLQDMPTTNDSALLQEDQTEHSENEPDLAKLMERIRARYRLVCQSTGFVPQNRAQAHEIYNNVQTDLDASNDVKNPSMVRIKGKLVNVNQLKY
ncbi:hypothetical protein ACI68E_002896 [Malassezia pachydermatis]